MIIEDETQYSLNMISLIDKLDQIIINMNSNKGRKHFEGNKCELCYFTGRIVDLYMQ